MTNELELKGASVRRLRKLLFCPSSEKFKDVFSDEEDKQDGSSRKQNNVNDDSREADNDDALASAEQNKAANNKKKKEKAIGQGRNPAKDCTGADKKILLMNR